MKFLIASLLIGATTGQLATSGAKKRLRVLESKSMSIENIYGFETSMSIDALSLSMMHGYSKSSKTSKAGKSAKASASPSPSPSPDVAWKQGNTFPATEGQTTNLEAQGGGDPKNVVCGSVQAVLAHPSDANICFAGAANGGVWRTTSCTGAEPDWVPLTDNEDSNSVGDIAFDGDTPATVIVAIGTRSSFTPAFSSLGGPGIGMLLTDNALDPEPTWTSLDNSGLFREKNVKFNSVYMRGNLILASAYDDSASPFECPNIGIWRSIDRGTSWTNVLSGVGRAIANDPNDETRFYATLDDAQYCAGGDASIPENGVFTSNDSGATWSPTASQSAPLARGELNNAKLSVSKDGSRVWSAILKDGRADSIAYSDDNGSSWTRMDKVQTEECDSDGTCTVSGLNPREKPGTQGSIHFSLLASPANKNEVYVGGDRQDVQGNFPNFIGATDFTGRLFRGNASIAATDDLIPSPQWDHMTNLNNIPAIPGGGTASGSAPHADSRDMELRVDGSILEASDGGITIRNSPSNNMGDWFGVCGNLQAFEAHHLAYEPDLQSVLYANQDTGTIVGILGEQGSLSLQTADGGVAMIDYKSDEDFIYYYASVQDADFFNKYRRDRTSGIITFVQNIPRATNASFVPVAAMNPSDQTNFALADGTDGSVVFYKYLTPTFFNEQTTVVFGAGYDPISDMTYSSDGMYLYAASTRSDGLRGAVSQCIMNPLTGFPSSCSIRSDQVNPGRTRIEHMAADPNDIDRVVAVAVDVPDYSNPQVFESVDGGLSWIDITGGDSPIAKAYNGHAVTFLSQEGDSFLIVGTSDGVYLRSNDSWKLLVDGLPRVAIWGMAYTSEDDRLVISTLGRGIWFLDNAFYAASVIDGGDISFSPIESIRAPPVDIVLDLPDGMETFPPDDYVDQNYIEPSAP